MSRARIRLLIVLAPLPLCLLVAGCGGRAGAQAVKTPVPPRATARAATAAPVTATPTPLPLPSATTGPQITPTVQPLPTSTAAPPAQQQPVLIYAQLRPDTVAPGESLEASVQVRGEPRAVRMFLGSGIPGSGGPQTYDLVESSPGVWTGAPTAPGVPGTYHFTVALFPQTGARILLDNDNWNIVVSGGPPTAAPTAAVLTLPDNIPLAPPFSYGNPVPVTFSAEGRSVSGAEVTSTTDTSVEPSLVAQFYEDHLPRAGWTVDTSTLPGQAATSFSIAATQGSQVIVVDFGAGTVQIFYGTFS